MDYWFLSVSLTNLILYGLLSLAWAAGGWLLAAHIFKLRSMERLLCGISAGWILFITLSNLFGQVMSLVVASWIAALLILFAGAWGAWRSGRPVRFPWKDLHAWPQLVWLAGLSVLFELIQRGLALFDEYLHLPIVSALAAGDLPFHFPFNPTQEFAYHYSLQLWAATMVRLANFTPWSAWDIARAFALALTAVLAWLWVRRRTRSGLLAGAGSFLLVFGGGTLWILLVMPHPVIVALTSHTPLVQAAADTAPTIAEALTRPWALDGGGPFPFPFAFINGIFMPVIFQFANTGAMVYVTVLMLLLAVDRKRLSWPSSIVVGLVLASLALSAEHLFFFLWIGLAVTLVITGFRQKRGWKGGELSWWAVLGLSGLLSLVQGGYITVIAHKVVAFILGLPTSAVFTETFSLRWPPALVSQKFGALSLLDPRQIFLLILEIGPVLLLIPLVIYLTRRWIKRDTRIPAALGLASFFCVTIPAFVKYGIDPSMVRFPDTAAWLWLCLSVPGLMYWVKKAGNRGQTLIGLGFFLTIFSGVVIFAVQLISIQAPQISYYIQGIDAQVAQQYWNRLEPGAQILSSNSSLTITIFGREVESNSEVFATLPEWDKLVKSPDPVVVAQAGFSYIYMDQGWWSRLTPDQQAALKNPCAKVIGDWTHNNEFRQLIDIQACR
jgi:hypothetical protein